MEYSPIFKNTLVKDQEVVYLFSYLKTANGYTSDERSKFLRINFKNEKNIKACKYFANQIEPQLGNDVVLVAIPPSHTYKNYDSAPHALIKEIITQSAGKKRIIDGSKCLYRHTDKEAEHTRRGRRSKEIHLKTMRVDNPELIRGKNVLVLDDIYTSGSSMEAAFDLLKEAGANIINGLAIGKTIDTWYNKDMNYAFILDIDRTFIDTYAQEWNMSSNNCVEATISGKDTEPLNYSTEFVDKVKEINNNQDVDKYFCMISKYPVIGARDLVQKMGLNDVKFLKNEKSKGLDKILLHDAISSLQTYEQCITFISSDKVSVDLANSIGLNGILVSSIGKMDTKHRSISNIEDLVNNFDFVISKCKQFKENLFREEQQHRDRSNNSYSYGGYNNDPNQLINEIPF